MRDGGMEETGRPGSIQAMVWVTRAGSKSLRSQEVRILTQEEELRVTWVRPVLGGRVLQEREHGLCILSLDPSSITYYSGDLQQARNLPMP